MKVLRRLRSLAGRSRNRGYLPFPTAGSRLGVHVDAVLRPDERTLFLSGWLWDPDAQVTGMSLRLGSKRRVAVAPAHFARRDVLEQYAMDPATRPGFVSCLPVAATDEPMRFEVHLRGGDSRWVEVPPGPIRCPFATRDRLVGMLEELSESDATLAALSEALTPAMARCAAHRRVLAEWTEGAPPAQPVASIVVPLYGDLDLVESQLDAFASDPEVRERAELIYVLDGPDGHLELQRDARALFGLYGVPARYLVLAHNAGFGGATNAGAAAARGDMLLLLNSDVVPVEPGWLGRLLASWSARADLGALSCKLLYEDRSLQHAGLYFAPGRVALHPRYHVELWTNRQYHKGLPEDLPAANVRRDVPAVSAACLLTPRRLYLDVGGLDESYVRGDCEDSDYCLELARRGFAIGYDPSISLYHLEGQSYPDHHRRVVSLYNNWLQDRRRRAAMVDRMTAFPDGGIG